MRTEQIVWNLVTNAIRFTPAGGNIVIALEVDEPVVRISVADSGIGLDASSLAGIFDIFKQVEAGAGRTRMGLGIGLALVKQLTELHGGHVVAESRGLGQGARFTVSLPIKPTAPSSGSAAPEDTGLRGMRLLVVDDEPDMLVVFSELLESEGAVVTAACNAEDALQAAVLERFDAILSDIGMPRHDGHWLARRLREDPRTTDVALVAVTGMARGTDRAVAIDAGFDALVGKPLDFVALRSEIIRSIAMHGGAGNG